jgi:hypothetical protein
MSDRLEKLRARKEQLEAKLRTELARERVRSRKIRARGLIVVGAAFSAWLGDELPETRAALLRDLRGRVSERDRAAFDEATRAIVEHKG